MVSVMKLPAPGFRFPASLFAGSAEALDQPLNRKQGTGSRELEMQIMLKG
jgi:hypothetical protein